MASESTSAPEAAQERPTPDGFDHVFSNVASSPRLKQLFDEVMGPFPSHVEPLSLVTRAGLDRVFEELQHGTGDRLVDLCCGRGGIGLWFADKSGAELVGVDFSPAAIARAEGRAGLFSGARASFVVARAVRTGRRRGRRRCGTRRQDARRGRPERSPPHGRRTPRARRGD